LKSGNKTIFLLVLFLLPAVLAAGGAWWYGRQNKTYQLAEDGVEGRYELPEIAYRQNRGATEPSYFTIQINAGPVADQLSKRCNLMIGNPQENKEYAKVRLILDETGEELFDSDFLKPGMRSAYVTLDRVPEPGTHSATAVFLLFEPDSITPTSEIEAGVMLTVE